MKQGTGTTYADRKVEPRATAVSVGGVAQIGNALGNKATDVPGTLPGGAKELYKGRGYEAPMNKSMQHRSGSQGRHE
jgi:hypothetical protein